MNNVDSQKTIGIRTYDQLKYSKPLNDSLSIPNTNTSAPQFKTDPNTTNPLMSRVLLNQSQISNKEETISMLRPIESIERAQSKVTAIPIEKKIITNCQGQSNPLMTKVGTEYLKIQNDSNISIQNPTVNMPARQSVGQNEILTQRTINPDLSMNEKKTYSCNVAPHFKSHDKRNVNVITDSSILLKKNTEKIIGSLSQQGFPQNTILHELQNVDEKNYSSKEEVEGTVLQRQSFIKTIPNKFHENFNDNSNNYSLIDSEDSFPPTGQNYGLLETSQSILDPSILKNNLNSNRVDVDKSIAIKNAKRILEHSPETSQTKKREIRNYKILNETRKRNTLDNKTPLEIESTYSFLNKSVSLINKRHINLVIENNLDVIPIKRKTDKLSYNNKRKIQTNLEEDHEEFNSYENSEDSEVSFYLKEDKSDPTNDFQNEIADETVILKKSKRRSENKSKPSENTNEDDKTADNNDLTFIMDALIVAFAFFLKIIATVIRSIGEFVNRSVTYKTIHNKKGAKKVVMLRLPLGVVIDLPESSYNSLKFWVALLGMIFTVLLILHK
jgi:hypothetical protein